MHLSHTWDGQCDVVPAEVTDAGRSVQLTAQDLVSGLRPTPVSTLSVPRTRDIYSMSIDMVLAFDSYAQVLEQAGYNHALADHDPNSGTPAPQAPNKTPPFTLSPQELVSLLVPPSTGGDGRGRIDDGLELAAKVGTPILDGDTKKLLRSADVWDKLANNDSVTAVPAGPNPSSR